MADQVATPMLGKWRAYTDGTIATATGAPRALGVVLLKTAEADATLRTRTTLAAILAASGNAEADWTSGTPYARKTGITPVSDTSVSAQFGTDIADQSWPSAGSTGAQQNLVKFCTFSYSTANVADAAQWLLLGHADFPEVANGATIVAEINASGILRASG